MCVFCLERHVIVLLLGILESLGAQELQILTYLFSSESRLDDVVDEATVGSREGIGELVDVLGLLLLDVLGRALEDDLHGSGGAHHGYFGCWPSVVRVAS